MRSCLDGLNQTSFETVTQTVLNDVRVHANAGNYLLFSIQSIRRQMGQVTIEGSGVPAFVF